MELNTNLIGLDGVLCTYWGWGKSEITLREDMIEEDFEDGHTDIHLDYYFSHFDNKKYMEDWNKAIQYELEQYLLDVIIYTTGGAFTYTAGGWWSPREYNFHHDQNDFVLEGDWDKIYKFCADHEDFPQFLKDNYTSCDGFTSFTTNNLEGWKLDFESGDATAYGAALRFMILDYGDDLALTVSEWFQDFFYAEYVDYEDLNNFKEEMEAGEVNLDAEWKRAIFTRDVASGVENVAKDEYMSLKTALEIAEEHYGEENKEIIAKAIERVWERIENSTLKLDL